MNKKFSILYVDDEESNLRIFKNTFRREYNVYTAISAKLGIELLKKESIDVILSDQRMPEMTGVEFLKYTQEAHPQLNRILITGFTDFGALQSAINEAKIFQYIQKPWQEKDLRNTIEEALKVYKLEQENRQLTEELEKKNEELTTLNKELQYTNEKLQIAKNKAEESDRLKSVFFANISHEIRTPMNGIIGFSRLLNYPDLTDKQRLEYTNIIVNSGEQLLNIIDDIIEISRLASSKVKLHLDTMDLNDFMNGLDKMYKTTINKKVSVHVINKLDKRESKIISDLQKINKILSNLIDNALKYTAQGFVNISCVKQNNQIVFSVEDSGIGISPEMQEVIFDHFRQEDENSTRQFGGLGIGLSIVKENVKLLEGEITLKSEKGKGSTFTFRIPYISDNESIDTISDNKLRTKAVSQKDEYTVLIAEDEKINSLYLETLLKNMNLKLKVIGASDGQEAIDICKKNKEIDLVFMDIKMPIVNGIEAITNIKKFRKDLHIIAQSAYTEIEEKEKAKLAGCSDFITKPINIDLLKGVISKYLIEKK